MINGFVESLLRLIRKRRKKNLGSFFFLIYKHFLDSQNDNNLSANSFSDNGSHETEMRNENCQEEKRKKEKRPSFVPKKDVGDSCDVSARCQLFLDSAGAERLKAGLYTAVKIL